MKRLVIAALSCTAIIASNSAIAADKQTLTIYAAGTLAGPFHEVDQAFEHANPGVSVEAQFGGSVLMAKKITDLHQPADILAVADYSVIPKYLFAQNGSAAAADWYVGFARNAITFVYTPKSKGATDVTPQNWYDVLQRSGVEIGRSNPDTDPSGYQTLQMLNLAEIYYKKPGLADHVLANAPASNIRDTETDLISSLQIGQIDYLAIYRSDAVQHKLKNIDMPSAIDLSDPAQAQAYASAVAHTKNGDLPGKPIVYAATIPSSASNPALAAKYIAFLLGPDGRAVFSRDGFGAMNPPPAVNGDRAPDAVKSLVKPWPGAS
ncbi:MAG TPA: extracellular solute-binding protein [Stellaceae bacterium]|jgi:molybdate/tungstate transport system substrate-binding protein|nr:extracellular solute-binding protein [Stellaceae bacterium]